MLAEYKTKTNLGIGLGILLNIITALFVHGIFRIPMVLVASGLFIWGCCMYAKGKGHHWALGFLGLLSLLGLIILLILPDKNK